jgi:hypothetical protein
MRCQEVSKKIHDFLDRELPSVEADSLERHLQGCLACRALHDELSWTKRIVSERLRLTEISQDHLWKHIQTAANRSFQDFLWEAWDNFRTFWRDLDRSIIWSKLSAVPVTVCFFIIIMMQFPQALFREFSYPAFAFTSAGASSEAVMTKVYTRHGPALSGLAAAAWRIPYEDSFSLIAQITPEGNAQIEDVLQYPKSAALLIAADSALRNSEFQTARNFINTPLVVFSFQKIDVYEEKKALF